MADVVALVLSTVAVTVAVQTRWSVSVRRRRAAARRAAVSAGAAKPGVRPAASARPGVRSGNVHLLPIDARRGPGETG